MIYVSLGLLAPFLGLAVYGIWDTTRELRRIRRRHSAERKAMKSIMDQEVECTENACDWSGTVNDCPPDVDGEGTIGCPLCQAAVREVTVSGDA